ncbi:cytochrome c1 [Rhizobacter sp. SG703]|uniref:cytochrome c1 n=1 Tax=Rhizobacter sp. SG703 TaxID=2587140 RepID=UPI0014461FB6|nr:cytochrome c1 [Rhizobacter sp. SG703]NKI92889.1 ubiquinol-cytochrome c reductase cytochrome c1 subunit [Rhizobacter sp. SG703]
MKKLLLTLLASLALAGGAARASEGGVAWDQFPVAKTTDLAALQNGAKLFVNYCLNCHSAAFMRYNRMRDIGLTEAQIKANLLFATDKVGDTMKTSLDPKQAKDWFGALPPDLSVIARSRADIGKGSGADYLYTYLRSYYRDDTKATGWNNLAFPSVAMPHALWELQGQRVAKFVEEKDPHDETKSMHRFAGFEQVTPGKLSPNDYDGAVADLVAYLQWMGEPAQGQRVRVGVWVLLFLSVFVVIAWRLNAVYWKDVK